MNVYLAGPIFTERDRMYLDYLCDKIIQPALPDANIYVPHRNKSINDKTKSATSYDVYWGDYNRLKETDLLIAVVSGDMPPIGTSCEIGMYTQMIDINPCKQLIALYDDCREAYVCCKDDTVAQTKLAAMRKEPGENQISYINIFLTGAIKTHGKLVTSSDELKDYLFNYFPIKASSSTIEEYMEIQGEVYNDK